MHIIIYAVRGSLAAKFPFAWPSGGARQVTDQLLHIKRTRPIFLGKRAWSGHRGTLILAPPLIFGGENGGHLIFRWKQAGIDRSISLHSWAPLPEAVATLRSVITSAR